MISRISSMTLADCYRLLGLEFGASTAEIKVSYRRLARKYHPDVNPDNEEAQAKFVELTEAYKLLLIIVNASQASDGLSQPQGTDGLGHQSPPIKVTRKEQPREYYTELSLSDRQLKWNSYQQLQQLLKSRRFARAIALAEGLAQRFPQDPEVRQWQAIAYSSWGRHLIGEKQLDKARIYLKKALRTDPHNRSLWTEVERDFRRLEQLM